MLELTQPSSKIESFRSELTRAVATSGDDACPAQALHYLFRWTGQPDTPLFQVDGALTRVMVMGQLRQTITLPGWESHYSGHSFHRGVATSAREAGLGNEESSSGPLALALAMTHG